MSIPLKYITDQKGKKTAVQIPINLWKSLVSEYRELIENRQMKTDLSEAIAEIDRHEKNEKKIGEYKPDTSKAMKALEALSEYKTFDKIKDPVKWQRQIRKDKVLNRKNG
ncbi:MAG: hypothetical protein WD048_08705 [Chitinophagales bacterium]